MYYSTYRVVHDLLLTRIVYGRKYLHMTAWGLLITCLVVASVVYMLISFKQTREKYIADLRGLFQDAKDDAAEFENLNASVGREVNENHQPETLLEIAKCHEQKLDDYVELCRARGQRALMFAEAQGPLSFAEKYKQEFMRDTRSAEARTERIVHRGMQICDRARDKAEIPESRLPTSSESPDNGFPR